MTAITSTIRDAWDNLLIRVAIIGLAVGWVPFYLLTQAHAALTQK